MLGQIKRNDFTRVTIIGAGFSGLEATDAFRSQNLEVVVIDRMSPVLAHHIDSGAATFIHDRMKQNGITFIPHAEVDMDSVFL